MTISVRTGTFTTPTVTDNFAVTGLGFQPKAIIFKLTELRTADDTHVFNGVAQGIGFGFSSGASDNYYFAGMCDYNGSSDSKQDRSSVDCVVIERDHAISERARGRIASFDADGFTLNFSVAVEAARVDYLAIGGDDVTGAKAFAFNDPTATGNFAVTGLGITPKMVIFGDAWTNTTVEMSLAPTGSSIRPQLSLLTAAASVSMCMAVATLNPAASTLMTSLRTDNRALVYGQISSSTPMSLATLVSMDADGFTLNYSTAFASSTRRCGIAIAGNFEVTCGVVTEPLTPGAVNVALPWTPKGGLIMSQGRADTTVMNGGTASDIEIDNSWGIWGATGGHFTTAWSAFRSASAAEMISAKNQANTFEVIDQTGTSTAVTMSELSLDGSTYGNANFDFTTVSGSGIAIAYLLFGDIPAVSQATRTTRRRLAPA